MYLTHWKDLKKLRKNCRFATAHGLVDHLLQRLHSPAMHSGISMYFKMNYLKRCSQLNQLSENVYEQSKSVGHILF